jgi:hypothetical protein
MPLGKELQPTTTACQLREGRAAYPTVAVDEV